MEGRRIEAYSNFHTGRPAGSSWPGGITMLIGGTHGDERATVPILESFIQTRLMTGLITEPTVVIPLHNPDGYARGTRYNARGADLNRNFPHNWSASSDEPSGDGPLSEPEARLLHDFIMALQPGKIVSLHWALAEIDADGPQSAPLAESMWMALDSGSRSPYRLRVHGPGSQARPGPAADPAPFQGTPGSLGQWCGHGLRYAPTGRRPAMITLELPYHPFAHPRPDPLPDDHLETVQSHWENDAGLYLAGVESTVHRLLEAACRFPGSSRTDAG